MAKTRRIITIAVAVLYLGIITSVFFLAYQRIMTLNDLRFKADKTVQSIYKLNNTTFNLVYGSEDEAAAREVWYSAYTKTAINLMDLIEHDGLTLIDESLVEKLNQTNNLLQITNLSFRDASEDLKKYVEGADDNLWFFSISVVEDLVNVIIKETIRVINLVLLVSSVITVFLFLLFLIVLIIRQRTLRNSNVNLEEEVQKRIRSIQNLLDYSGEGFLSFDSDLIIKPEYSRECVDIFGEEIAGKSIDKVLYEEIQDQTIFVETISQVFQGLSKPEEVLEIIDRKIKIRDKIIELDFHLSENSAIICQFNDVTENELLQRKVEQENARREMILRVVSSKKEFTNIKAEGEALFEAINCCLVEGKYKVKKKENDNIIRKLHHFRMNAKLLRMTDTYNSAQDLETALIDYGVLYESEPLEPKISLLKESFNEEALFIVDTLGKNWIKEAGRFEVKLENLEQTKKMILKKYPNDNELIKNMKLLNSIKLSSLFERLSDLTKQLANSNGKKINVRIKCDDIFVSTDLFKRLSDSATHILRNMVTHGIEFPGHREKAGKPLSGRIDMTAVQEGSEIILKFADDGAGIAVDQIKKKAISEGKVEKDASLTDAEYVKLIFMPDFSTADTVTAISGRGYGLSAVKERINEIGGKIKVASSKGNGTKFTLVVPNTVTA